MWLLSWFPAQACVQNKQYRHSISFDCKSHIGSPNVVFACITKDGFFWLFLSAMSEGIDKNPWPTRWSTSNQPILLCLENRFDCCDQAKPGRDVIHTICSSIPIFSFRSMFETSKYIIYVSLSNWCLYYIVWNHLVSIDPSLVQTVSLERKWSGDSSKHFWGKGTEVKSFLSPLSMTS